MELTTRAVLEKARDGHHLEALTLIDRLLTGHPDCPYLLVFRSILITLENTGTGPSLREAEQDLLQASAVDKSYLPALEELAHYYDAVEPDQKKARLYAAKYVELAGQVISEMKDILKTDSPDVH